MNENSRQSTRHTDSISLYLAAIVTGIDAEISNGLLVFQDRFLLWGWRWSVFSVFPERIFDCSESLARCFVGSRIDIFSLFFDSMRALRGKESITFAS